MADMTSGAGSGTKLVQRVVRAALETFSGGASVASSPQFLERLAHLQRLVHQLTEQDVGFDRCWVRDKRHIKLRWPAPPMTYVRLVDSSVLSVGIFILHHGFRMPLHDHPDMYGVLKVLYGSVQVQSYSRAPPADEAADGTAVAGQAWDTRQTTLGPIYRTVREPPQLMKPQDAARVLTPHDGNIHEISACDGPAAFLDILAPPYDDHLHEFHCFQELSPAALRRLTDGQLSETGWLIRVNGQPLVSDSVEYQGPPLDGVMKGVVQDSR